MATATTLITRTSPLALAVGFGALLLFSAGARAEFVLNWSQQSANPAFFPDQQMTGCNQPPCVWHDREPELSGPVQNQTPFLYERVTLDGVTYYHMVLGDPDTGFAQEVFIGVGVGNTFLEAGGPDLDPNVDPTVEGADGPLPSASSASLGFTDQSTFDGGGFSAQANPLGQNQSLTGNSTGNPMRVQMRQLMTDGELTVDFVKDVFLDKPNIRSELETSEIRLLFLMDSSGNRYDTMATPSAVTNTLQLLDPEVPEGSALFDAAQAVGASITAGRYTYTPTVGAFGTEFGGAGGTYQYFDGGANLNPDWSSFFDHREANPWAIPTNRPTP
jgi:hypothetical protein